jgi:tetratricopeptide (TPR) repeat protein
MTFERGHFFVGDLVRNRREWLEWNPWLSYARVLRVRDVAKLSDDDRSMFYAQSWALVHFLLLGPHRPHFQERMKLYMEAVEAGAPDAAAFAAAFAEEPKDLTRRVLEYLNGEAKIWPMPLPPQDAHAAPGVRALLTDEIAARIGRVALVSGDLKVAQKAIDASLAANPANAMALVGKADLHKVAGRFEQGEPLYLRAIELEPSDAYHKLDYAEYFYHRAAAAVRQQEPERAAEWIVEARRQLARSYKLDDGVPETLAMNGATYLGEAEGAARAVESLEEAYAMLPSQPQIKLLLAQAYAKADRKREAARLIRSLVAWGHTGGSKEAAAFLQALESETKPDEPGESAVPDAGSEDGGDTP